MVERLTFGDEISAYSTVAIASGRMAYVSGHGPLRDGAIVSGTVEEQTRLTLENLRTTIERAGGTLDGVVKCSCFLADPGDFHAFDGVYREFFAPGRRPARTTVVAGLYGGMKVEIEAVVALAE